MVESLLERARTRCREHRRAAGVCGRCLLAEFRVMLREQYESLTEADLDEIVAGWIMSEAAEASVGLRATH